MLVLLNYFKSSGKWYSSADWHSSIDLSMDSVWTVVKQMKDAKKLPGLMPGHSDFIVLVQVPEHPHNVPHLIL